MDIVPVTKAQADLFVRQKHYSRRASIFWAAFGLVINGKIEGVVVYGQPSPPIQKHAFVDRDFRLYELARLVVQTKERNAASTLVGRSLQMLPGPCAVVSYADSSWGHSGIIYQATNWLYTGATKSHDHLYLLGDERIHPMTLRDWGVTDPKKWAEDFGVPTLPPQPKHRYFQFVGNRRERNAMRAKLKYPEVKPYPKSEKTMYDDGPRLEVNA